MASVLVRMVSISVSWSRQCPCQPLSSHGRCHRQKLVLQVDFPGFRSKPAGGDGVNLSHRLRWETDGRIAVMHGSDYVAVDVPSAALH